MDKTHLVLIYFILGALVMLLIAPAYLKQKGIEAPFRWKDAFPAIASHPPAALILIIFAVAFWPIITPIYVISEASAKREKDRFQRNQREEDLRRQTDRHRNLSIEEKMALLRKTVDDSTERSNK